MATEFEYKSELDVSLDEVLRLLGKGCLVLIGLFFVLVAVFYVLSQPWLPYTEVEIQQVLTEKFGARARLSGFHQYTENCRIAYFESDSLGNHYVNVERENGQWKYVDDAYWAGDTLLLECP